MSGTCSGNCAGCTKDKPETFTQGQRVRKKSGSEWQGRIVGWYSTALTPEGYAVESEAHPGSVQIYPASALERANPKTNSAGHSVECLYEYALSRLNLKDSEAMRTLFWDAHNALQYDPGTDTPITPPNPDAWTASNCPACDAPHGCTPDARDLCNQSVYDNGISIGLFDLPKDRAEDLCMGLSRALGVKFDWHYIAGRVHIKALAAPRPTDSVVAQETGN